MSRSSAERRLLVGAEIVPEGVEFRVWAPRRKRVEVVLEHATSKQLAFELATQDGGYFMGLVREARHGARYRFRLDGGSDLAPDPASGFQPEGPIGPSQVVDPRRADHHLAKLPEPKSVESLFASLHKPS